MGHTATHVRIGWQGWFLFRLETADGSPASPSTLEASVANWRAGDVISLGRGRRQLRVIGKRDDDADPPPGLVVEEF
jgi:hypothetical protein